MARATACARVGREAERAASQSEREKFRASRQDNTRRAYRRQAQPAECQLSPPSRGSLISISAPMITGGLCLHCGMVRQTETFVKHLFRQRRSGSLSKYLGCSLKPHVITAARFHYFFCGRFFSFVAAAYSGRHVRTFETPATCDPRQRSAPADSQPTPHRTPLYRCPAGWRPGRQFPTHARHISLIRPFSWFVGPPRPRGIYFARRFPGSFRQARYRLILLAGEFLYSGIAECVFRITAKEASP